MDNWQRRENYLFSLFLPLCPIDPDPRCDIETQSGWIKCCRTLRSHCRSKFVWKVNSAVWHEAIICGIRKNWKIVLVKYSQICLETELLFGKNTFWLFVFSRVFVFKPAIITFFLWMSEHFFSLDWISLPFITSTFLIFFCFAAKGVYVTVEYHGKILFATV